MEDSRKRPSFDEFAEFVRDWAGISRKKKICVESKFEDDLVSQVTTAASYWKRLKGASESGCPLTRMGIERHFSSNRVSFSFTAKDFQLTCSNLSHFFAAPWPQSRLSRSVNCTRRL